MVFLKHPHVDELIEDEPVPEKTRQLETKHVFVSPFLTPLLLFP